MAWLPVGVPVKPPKKGVRQKQKTRKWLWLKIHDPEDRIWNPRRAQNVKLLTVCRFSGYPLCSFFPGEAKKENRFSMFVR